MFSNQIIQKIIVALLTFYCLSGCQNSSSQFNNLASEIFSNVTDESALEDNSENNVETEVYAFEKKQLLFKSFANKNALENIRMAISNDPRVLSKMASINVAKEDIEIAKSFSKFQSSAIVTGGVVSENRDTDAAAAVVLSANQMLYDFGSSAAQLDISLKSYELAKIDALVKAEEVALNGFELWVYLYKQKQIYKVYERGLELAKPLLGQIENISTSGVADKRELLAAKEKYARLQQGANQAKSALIVAEANFLEFFPGADVSEIEQLQGIKFLDNVTGYDEKIMRSNPIQYQLLSEKILLEKIKMLQGKEKPTLSFSSTVNAPLKDTLDDGDLNAGLLVNYVFNDGGRTSGEIKKVESELVALENLSKSLYFDLNNQLRVQIESYESNTKKRASFIELRDLAKEVRDTAKAQLVSGRSSIKDVMNAEVSLAESQVELISTDADLAVLSYRAVGILGSLLPYVGWEISQ